MESLASSGRRRKRNQASRKHGAGNGNGVCGGDGGHDAGRYREHDGSGGTGLRRQRWLSVLEGRWRDAPMRTRQLTLHAHDRIRVMMASLSSLTSSSRV